MNRTGPEPARRGPAERESPRRVVLVLGTSAGGTGTHVRMLADGLAGRGVAVTVAGPSSAGARLAFSAVPGVSFAAVEIGDRPRPGDLASILRLRRLLAASADVVHAHGLRAGALSLLALALGRRGRRPAAVVTVHNAPRPPRAPPPSSTGCSNGWSPGALTWCSASRPTWRPGCTPSARAASSGPSSRCPKRLQLSPALPLPPLRSLRRLPLRGLRRGRSSSAPGGWRRRRGSACCPRRPPPWVTWTRCRSW